LKNQSKNQPKGHKIVKAVEKKATKKAISEPARKPADNHGEVKKAPSGHAAPSPVQPTQNIAKQTLPPGREFRPWVIWIWNLSITKDELVKQLRFFIERRFAGVAIKIGRDMTPAFLSEEFFSLFNEVLLIAQSEKIGIRLAEDFSMPVHGAFEAIALKNKSLRGQYCTLEHTEQIQNKADLEKTIADPASAIVQIAKFENEKVLISKLRTMSVPLHDNPVISWKGQPGVHQLMIFRKKYAADPLGGYVPNVYREQSARIYADTVWEAFHKHFSKFMPLTFEGFITEIPAYLPADNAVPWDDDLVVKYRSKYKKNLLSVLPSLFFATEQQEARNRPHIYSFLLQSMHERFTATLDKWCKKYRLSNWVLCPERPVVKSTAMLRDCMAIPSQNFGVVGIQNQEGSEENAPIVHAMADANAREFRRETITVIGRNRQGNASSLQDLKSEIDQSAMTGPSRILLDGCFFNVSHKSFIKTPCNPSWYSPGAENLSDLSDYASRVKKLITPLQLTRQVAILLPSQSVMTDFCVSNDEPVRKSILAMHNTMDELQTLNLDFDVISEEMLLSCSLFSNGEFNSQSKVRKGNYQALVVPYCRMVSKNLFVYLERMAVKKGTIIFVGEAPQGTIDDGITPAFTSRVAKLLRSRTGRISVTPAKEIEPSLAHIKPVASVTVQGKKCSDIAVSCGADVSQSVYCMVNKSDAQDYFAAIELPEEKYFYLADCTTGEIHEIEDVQRKDDTCRINLNIAPRQSHFIMASSQKVPTTSLPKGKQPSINLIGTVQRNYRIVLKDQWQFSLCSLNVLPLAAWNTRIGLSREFGGFSHFYETYFEVKEVPEVALFSLCGLTDASAVISKNERSIEVNINGSRVNDSGPLDETSCAALFPVPAATVSPDGHVVHAHPLQEHSKPCLDLFTRNVLSFNIKDSIRKGLNRISLRTLGMVFDPMAIVYPPLIAGSFAIIKGSNGWVIDTAMPMVSHDSWTKYGFPYLSGCGTYKQVFEIPSDYNRLVLKLSQVSGSTSVSLNNVSLATFNWHPMEIDITDICESKRNELAVSVVNTVDNMIRMNNRPSGLIGEAYLDVY
jgi:hypothetical protein